MLLSALKTLTSENIIFPRTLSRKRICLQTQSYFVQDFNIMVKSGVGLLIQEHGTFKLTEQWINKHCHFSTILVPRLLSRIWDMFPRKRWVVEVISKSEDLYYLDSKFQNDIWNDWYSLIVLYAEFLLCICFCFLLISDMINDRFPGNYCENNWSDIVVERNQSWISFAHGWLRIVRESIEVLDYFDLPFIEHHN